MKDILKNGGKLFLKTIVINIMCFFVVISLVALGIAVFADNIGYEAYGTKSKDDEPVRLYIHYSADGEDTKLEEYKEQGYTIQTHPIKKIGKTNDIIISVVAQCFSLGIFIAFIYPNLWDMGFKDNNLVNTGHMKKDILKGLKIGSVAALPAFLLYLFLMITKSGLSADVPISLYRLMNSAFYPLIGIIANGSVVFKDLNVLRSLIMVIPILLIPLTAFISYYLGYKGVAIGEKLTYKKDKKQER